jgi:hypothetical protein
MVMRALQKPSSDLPLLRIWSANCFAPSRRFLSHPWWLSSLWKRCHRWSQRFRFWSRCARFFVALAPSDSDETPPVSHMLWRWTLPITGLAAFAVIVAQLFGFLALSAFIVDRLVWTSVVLAGLHLAGALVEGLTSATLYEDTPASVCCTTISGCRGPVLGNSVCCCRALSSWF